MKSLEIVTYVSIAVIAVSLFFIGTEITGFATTDDTGVVNVTIEVTAALNFTTELLDFGSGAVDGGAAGATLSSAGAGSTTDGTWTPQPGQLILENIGNTNVTLNLTTNILVADFIGGSNPTFKANVSDNETGSCTGTQTFSSFTDISTSQQTACGVFEFNDNRDSINVDFEIYVPSDAVGAKTVNIIATGEY
jgi:hypothetical protein